GSLVADGHRQGQVVFGELDRQAVAIDDVAGVGGRVEVDDAERLVPALHRYADRLADAEPDDALPGAEAAVLGGVGDQHALLLAEDVVRDGAAEGDAFRAGGGGAPANRLRLELVGGGVVQHDAAPVRPDRAEDQLHDPLEELVEVEDVADGL